MFSNNLSLSNSKNTIVGSQDRKICNFYGSTEMSDVTFAVFTSLEDLYEQMDDSNKVWQK